MHSQSEGPVVIKVVDGEAAEPAWLSQRTGSRLCAPRGPGHPAVAWVGSGASRPASASHPRMVSSQPHGRSGPLMGCTLGAPQTAPNGPVAPISCQVEVESPASLPRSPHLALPDP